MFYNNQKQYFIMRKLEGGFELSINVLVTAVLAVIVLVAGIYFVSELIKNTSKLSCQITKAAEEELLKNLQSSKETVMVKQPSKIKCTTSDVIVYGLGIRNKFGSSRMFYINISLVKSGALSEGDLGFTSIRAEANSWLVYAEEEFVEASASTVTNILIKPKEDAEPGIYLFKAYVCTGTPCNKTSHSIYGDAVFHLEIKR
jgi:hypothetical protein